MSAGRFFDSGDGEAGAVAVLGHAAAASLFGTDEAVGRHVNVNQQWFRVIGVAGPQLAAQIDLGGLWLGVSDTGRSVNPERRPRLSFLSSEVRRV